MSVSNKLIRNYLYRFLIIFIQFGTYLLLAFYKQPDFAGKIGIVLTAMNISNFLSFGGLNNTYIRYGESFNLNGVIRLGVIFKLFLVLFCFLGASLWIKLPTSEVILSLIIFGLSFLLTLPVQVSRTHQVRELNIKKAKMPELLFTTLYNIFWSTCIILGLGNMIYYAVAYLLATILSSALAWKYLKQPILGLKGSKSLDLNENAKRSFQFLISELPTFLIKNIDLLIVYYVGGLDDAGVYFYLKSFIKIVTILIEEAGTIYFSVVAVGSKDDKSGSWDRVKYESYVFYGLFSILICSSLLGGKLFTWLLPSYSSLFFPLLMLIAYITIYNLAVYADTSLLANKLRTVTFARWFYFIVFVSLIFLLFGVFSQNLYLSICYSYVLCGGMYTIIINALNKSLSTTIILKVTLVLTIPLIFQLFQV